MWGLILKDEITNANIYLDFFKIDGTKVVYTYEITKDDSSAYELKLQDLSLKKIKIYFLTMKKNN